MKRVLILTTICIMAFACKSGARKQATAQPAEPKILVAYFSASGTTANAASILAGVLGADLFEIAPVQPYSAADLDWTDKQSRTTLEMKDPSSRPAIKATVENIADYDTIYIGFPIWWYRAPYIISTFIEAHDLSGKKLIPFATSGSSSIDGSAKALREEYPTLNWQSGLLLNHATKASIRSALGL